jgi:hypothetical protein
MEVNLITLLGISLAAMFFGYFFGLFEGRGQGARKRKAEEASDNASKVSLETPLPPPSPLVTPAENRLLAINLDESHQPQLELDGQRVNATHLAPEQRKRLIELMLILRPWVEGKPVQKQSVSPQPAPRPVTGPLPQAKPLAATTRQASPAPAAPATVPVPVPEPAPNSMVSQIDAILQARLVGTPLEERGIRLVESIQGGALVFVGNKSYEGVGEVPDPEVQAAIRAATAEWERRYTPGY